MTAKRETKARPGSADELMQLYPAPKIIPVRVKRVSEVDGVRKVEWEHAEVVVERLAIRELGSVLSVLAPIMRDIGSVAQFADLVFNNLEEYYAAIGRAIRWPSDRVAMMDGDDCGIVARTIYDENRDFFGRHLGPVVSGLLETVVATMLRGAGAGSMHSPTSVATEAQTTRPASP